jgi:ribulose-bisphosphate carboxylase large chain
MSQPGARSEFTARYFVESTVPADKVAEIIAGEQSSGTFVTLPGETAQLKERSRARVTRVLPMTPSAQPTLHSAVLQRQGLDGPFERAEIEIAFPVDNVGANLPSLLATVAGNLFELGEVTALRLLDLDLSPAYAAEFQGPAFGIEGTRQLAGVHGRPLVGTIVKPSIGLSAEQTAQLVDSLCAAGIDFIKDDELMANAPYEPFAARLAAVMPVLHRHADRLGRMPMYAFNVSGSIDDMLRQSDAVAAAGGTCVMVSVNWMGFAGVEHLRKNTDLPIHGHRNGWGALTRHPGLGFSFAAYQKLWRLAGVDHLHVNGPSSKFWEPDASVFANAQDCLRPFAGLQPLMPVFSSGQWAGLAPEIYRQLTSCDLMHLAGGGIIGHPDGTAAGVQSMRQAWDAAVAGVDLQQAAVSHSALARALSHFGVS